MVLFDLFEPDRRHEFTIPRFITGVDVHRLFLILAVCARWAPLGLHARVVVSHDLITNLQALLDDGQVEQAGGSGEDTKAVSGPAR